MLGDFLNASCELCIMNSLIALHIGNLHCALLTQLYAHIVNYVNNDNHYLHTQEYLVNIIENLRHLMST